MKVEKEIKGKWKSYKEWQWRLESINFIPLFLTVGAREIYERAVEFFGEEHADEKLFLAFGKFEEKCKEVQIKLLLNSVEINARKCHSTRAMLQLSFIPVKFQFSFGFVYANEW